MGNAPATLAVVFDDPRPCYASGQPLSGRVYLSVTSAEETVADSLQLTVSGAEHTTVHYTTSHSTGHGKNRKTVRKHHYAHARRVLFSIVVPLATFEGGRVRPGQYEYPWRIDALPEGLPSSMFASADAGRSKARVTYAVQAHLHRPGMFKRDVHAETPFVVSAAPSPAVPSPVFLPPATRPVRQLCCISKGSMTLGAMVDRAVVPRGGHVAVSYAIKNNSTQELQTMRVSLTEVVRWSARGHHERYTRTLAQSVIDPATVAGAARLDGAQGGARPGSAVATMELEATRQIHAALKGGTAATGATAVVLPSNDARDSYNGSIVHVTHHLSIVLMTACCTSNPEISTQLYVRPPPLPLAPSSPLANEGEIAGVALHMTPDAPWASPPLQDPDIAHHAAPMQALPADWSATTQPLMAIPMATAVRDGAIEAVVSDDAGAAAALPAVAAPVAASPTAAVAAASPGSLVALRTEMSRNNEDLATVTSFVADEASALAIRAMTPADYGSIVGAVAYAFEQPQVAEVLARALGTRMTCAHLAAATAASSLSKAEIVLAVAPLCADLATQGHLIRACLSPFEQFLCETVLNAGVPGSAQVQVQVQGTNVEKLSAKS